MSSHVYDVTPSETSKRNPETLLWRSVVLITVIIAFCSFILGCVNITTISKRSTSNEIPVSCAGVKAKTSGLYMIQPDKSLPKLLTYCDMTSSGGGWTLVASIHENNIDGKCSSGDKWSSEQGNRLSYRRKKNSILYNGTKNWENLNVFGNVFDLTKDDYKNTAYYSTKASNVLIWHVPNNTPIKELESRAFLKYRTTNNFLAKYGSNLQTLYAKHAQVKHAGTHRYYKLISPPVQYLVGNDSFVLSRIPESERGNVEPGYLQFRAFDTKGYANALCPAVKMTKGDPTRICVGSGRARVTNVCGDFAGWGGDSSGRSRRLEQDIQSSLLIFTK